jgi:hypothetical protein
MRRRWVLGFGCIVGLAILLALWLTTPQPFGWRSRVELWDEDAIYLFHDRLGPLWRPTEAHP